MLRTLASGARLEMHTAPSTRPEFTGDICGRPSGAAGGEHGSVVRAHESERGLQVHRHSVRRERDASACRSRSSGRCVRAWVSEPWRSSRRPGLIGPLLAACGPAGTSRLCWANWWPGSCSARRGLAGWTPPTDIHLPRRHRIRAGHVRRRVARPGPRRASFVAAIRDRRFSERLPSGLSRPSLGFGCRRRCSIPDMRRSMRS